MASTSSSAPARVRGQAGLHRVKAKLKTAMQEGNWYEAHQMYRTMYFRLNSQGRHSELEELLYEGASSLFKSGESGSGVDLTKLYLETLRSGDLPRGDATFSRAAGLFALVPPDHADRDSVAAAALRWSSPADSRHGHPRLHQLLAHGAWRAGRYAEARLHFLHSCDGRGCGEMLAEFHSRRGLPREVDLFVTGTALQLICLRQHVAAASALASYAEKHPSIQRPSPPYQHPLMNFVWLLLLAIENKKSLSVFSLLVMKYQTSLNRDKSFMEYVDKIGQNYFGVPPPERARPGGIFGGFFDSFVNMLNDDDDESEDDGAAAAARRASSGPSRARPAPKMETEDLD